MTRFRPIILIALSCALCVMQSCTKESDPPQTTVFSISAPDSLAFEHSGTKALDVSVQSTSDNSFVASLSGVNSSFNHGGQELVISSGNAGSFQLQFNQFGIAPGSYDCELTVSVANENNTPQSKNIHLVYSPNCAYDFKDHQHGEITYQINGNLQNRSITCNYDDEGQLVVNGLTTYEVVLNLNCANETVVMVPVTNLGFNMTADGTIQGSVIHLNFYSNGASHAVAQISI